MVGFTWLVGKIQPTQMQIWTAEIWKILLVLWNLRFSEEDIENADTVQDKKKIYDPTRI